LPFPSFSFQPPPTTYVSEIPQVSSSSPGEKAGLDLFVVPSLSEVLPLASITSVSASSFTDRFRRLDYRLHFACGLFIPSLCVLDPSLFGDFGLRGVCRTYFQYLYSIPRYSVADLSVTCPSWFCFLRGTLCLEDHSRVVVPWDGLSCRRLLLTWVSDCVLLGPSFLFVWFPSMVFPYPYKNSLFSSLFLFSLALLF